MQERAIVSQIAIAIAISETNFVRIPDRCSYLFGIIILVWLCSLYLELLWKIVHLSIDLVVVVWLLIGSHSRDRNRPAYSACKSHALAIVTCQLWPWHCWHVRDHHLELYVLSMWRQILSPCSVEYSCHAVQPWGVCTIGDTCWIWDILGMQRRRLSPCGVAHPRHAVCSICGSYPSNMGTSNISVEYPHNALSDDLIILAMQCCISSSCHVTSQCSIARWIQLSLPICHSTMTWRLNRSFLDHSRSSNRFSQPVAVGILGVERDSRCRRDSQCCKGGLSLQLAAGILAVARSSRRRKGFSHPLEGFSQLQSILVSARDSHTTYKVHNTSRIVEELPWANKTVRVWWRTC